MLADEFHSYAVLPLILGGGLFLASYSRRYRGVVSPRVRKWERRIGIALLALALVMWLGGLALGY